MKKVRLISTSFEDGGTELQINTPLIYKDYQIDLALYNNSNTPSRVSSLHPRMKCKVYKMMDWLEHPGYDYYIWINSKFTIQSGFFETMFEFENEENAGDYEMFLFNHHERSSIRAEMNFMNARMGINEDYLLSRYGGDVMEEQVVKYLADENFVDNKLYDGAIFMYSRKLVVNKDQNLMTDWLLHNTLYSVQDQLWFPYLLNKYKVKYRVYPHHLFRNSFLKHSG